MLRLVLFCLGFILAAPGLAADRFGDYDRVDFGPRGPAIYPVHGIDVARFQNEINFYKNISIIGGLLVLYVAGAGRYAIDAALEGPSQR